MINYFKNTNKNYLAFSVLIVSVLIAGGILYFSKISKSVMIEDSSYDMNFDFDNKYYDNGVKPEELEWGAVINYRYGYSYIEPRNYDQAQFFTVNVDRSTSTLFDFAKKFASFGDGVVLNKSYLNGREVYQFTYGATSTRIRRGEEMIEDSYLISAHEQVNILETDLGVKIIIIFPVKYYRKGVFNKMLNSFVVDRYLIPKIIQPQNWVKIEGVKVGDESFSFKYPSNIFTQRYVDYSGDPNISWGKTFDSPNQGGFSVKLEENEFNVYSSTQTFSDEGLIIEKEYFAEGAFREGLLKGRKTYSYNDEGHGGCSLIVTLVPIKEKTISISFGSCQDDAYYFSEQVELMQSILDTFEFKQ